LFVMRITVTTVDGEVYPVEIGLDETLENVKIIMEAETGIPATSQVLLFEGKPLADGLTSSAAGLKENDLLLLMKQPEPASRGAPQSSSAGGAPANRLGLAPDGSAADPAAMMRQIGSNAHLMQQLASGNPRLHEAVQRGDAEAFQGLLREEAKRRQDEEAKRQQEMQRLMADPLNPENQAKIAEMINQKNVQEAFENAMEHNPELFGTVIMLYVDMEVNGSKVKAFVDSGAQSTIMSKRCAEEIGIMRLCDTRFSGIAKGVGTSRIIGRVHAAPLKVGSSHLTASITIIEQDDMDFLFGLDMLKRHQCMIDLMNNELKFGSCGESLRFLPEHELPARARQADSDAPPPPPPPESVPGQTGNSDPKPTTSSYHETANTAGVESKISQLVQLGFSQAQAMQALNACGGDVDQAAALLFGGW